MQNCLIFYYEKGRRWKEVGYIVWKGRTQSKGFPQSSCFSTCPRKGCIRKMINRLFANIRIIIWRSQSTPNLKFSSSFSCGSWGKSCSKREGIACALFFKRLLKLWFTAQRLRKKWGEKWISCRSRETTSNEKKGWRTSKNCWNFGNCQVRGCFHLNMWWN